MTTSRVRVFLLMLCLLAAPLLVVSQVRGQMGPGMGIGPDYYDGSSSTVIRGVVETVEANAYNCHWGATEVTLKADKDTYIVQLGPTPFLSQNNFNIAKGDEVRVSGFKFTCQGTTFLIAQDVTKGGKTLTLPQCSRRSGLGRARKGLEISQWLGGRTRKALLRLPLPLLVAEGLAVRVERILQGGL